MTEKLSLKKKKIDSFFIKLPSNNQIGNSFSSAKRNLEVPFRHNCLQISK